jgi:enterochelin esterase-like enzyme
MRPGRSPSGSLRWLPAAAITLALAGCGGNAVAAHRRTAATPRATPSPAATVLGSFHSAAIRGTEHYAVRLPAGYRTSGLRYPVIYALHGLPTDSDAYQRMPIASWDADAGAAGRPVIVVSPQGARKGDSDPEWHNWGPGRDWETVVSSELVRVIDHRFRTIANRRARAIVGMSAGGYGASIIGVRHLGEFSAIESWSGYFYPTNPAGTARLPLGSPDADEAATVQSYVKDARHFFVAGPTFFGFYVGDEDARFLPLNQRLNADLRAALIPHVYAVYHGAHVGSFWAAHERGWIAAAVRFLWPARRT